MKDIHRTFSLYCPVCGNDQFSCIDNVEFDDLSDAPDDTQIQCSICKNIYTKAGFLEQNQDIINANINEIEQEAIKVFEKELKKLFK